MQNSNLWFALNSSVKRAIEKPGVFEWPANYRISREQMNGVLRDFLDRTGKPLSAKELREAKRVSGFRKELAKEIDQEIYSGKPGAALDERIRNMRILRISGERSVFADAALPMSISKAELAHIANNPKLMSQLGSYQQFLVKDLLSQLERGQDPSLYLWKGEINYIREILKKAAR